MEWRQQKCDDPGGNDPCHVRWARYQGPRNCTERKWLRRGYYTGPSGFVNSPDVHTGYVASSSPLLLSFSLRFSCSQLLLCQSHSLGFFLLLHACLNSTDLLFDCFGLLLLLLYHHSPSCCLLPSLFLTVDFIPTHQLLPSPSAWRPV